MQRNSFHAAKIYNQNNPFMQAIAANDADNFCSHLDQSDVNTWSQEFSLGNLTSMKTPLMLVLDKLEACLKANAPMTALQSGFFNKVIAHLISRGADVDLGPQIVNNVVDVARITADTPRKQAQQLAANFIMSDAIQQSLALVVAAKAVDKSFIHCPDFH